MTTEIRICMGSACFARGNADNLEFIEKYIKEKYPDVISVFISPCVAKRKEVQSNENVDYVLNADELGAIFVGRKIEILEMEDDVYDYDSSRQARNFGVIGGVAAALIHC